MGRYASLHEVTKVPYVCLSELISGPEITSRAFLMTVYLLHAYDFCPDESMFSLCLTIASIGCTMQRQSDRHQHLATQAQKVLAKVEHAVSVVWWACDWNRYLLALHGKSQPPQRETERTSILSKVRSITCLFMAAIHPSLRRRMAIVMSCLSRRGERRSTRVIQALIDKRNIFHDAGKIKMLMVG